MKTLLFGLALTLCVDASGGSATESSAGPEPVAADQDTGKSELERRVEEILSAPAEEGEYRQTVRCIASSDYQRVDILDGQRLVFHGRGDKRWLNQLRIRCPGLRRNDTLRFEVRSRRLCEMDTFSSIDNFGYGSMGSGNCALGKFEPMHPDQVQMLKDALRAERESKKR